MKIKKLQHLSKIFQEYDAFIIDLWGVMHDGIKLNDSAINAVRELEANSKKVVFLSNAPRPAKKVVEFLKKMKMDDSLLKNVLTSGEAAMNSLKKNKFGKKFYHLGPQRDDSLFFELKKNKTTLAKCDFILCTGLFDGEEENLNYYSDLLRDFTKKKFVCTNPDLIVHRGIEEEYCAGKIAEIFESLGGKVIYFGKPHKEVYLSCLDKDQKTLVIGDNLNTDIKGANNMNLDSIFITGGIHKSKINNEETIGTLLKEQNVSANYFQDELTW
ncbi:MAG: TIGR01459 family HAD-type hydrolase [Candidatus Marinimicrobia bacterium]|nr:TIGR01459 family HAD-type hydrolase [Candidatus Neomarinimicrobiota bacterium]RPG05363.1 MAG: TIGR01459 family HAD-type hydrolase [Pelagibacteraceae bacterium TMED247]